ncbi:MAG: hypothetical protein ACOY46_20650 [Bacillota bacterium]
MHFQTHVLAKPSITDLREIEQIVRQTLTPFCELLEVDPYDTECECVGYEAKLFAENEANQKIKPIQDLRKEYRSIPKDERPVWAEYIKDWLKVYNEALEQHPLYGKASAGCWECNGTGIVKTTHNPNSKWDWWVIGGRWDGIIKNDFQMFKDDFYQNSIENNIIKASEMTEDHKMPYAILTPDGKWHTKGEIDWFQSNKKDDINWLKEAMSIYKQYSDYWVVACDLHI